MNKKNVENTQAKKEMQAQKERLDNFVVMLTSIVLGVGVVLAVLYNYLNSSHIGAAFAFLTFLQWAGVLAVLVFAVLGFVLKNKKLFIWCAVSAYVSINCLIIMRLGTGIGNSVYVAGVAICYYMLALALIAGYIYYALAVNNIWSKKAVRIVFYIITILLAAIILGFAAYQMIPTFMIHLG